MSNDALKKIPYLGVGIGLRNEIADATLEHERAIDVLEIISERFFNRPAATRDFLRRFSNAFPIIPHGVKLSIASAMDIDRDFLKNMKKLCEFVRASYYSDHFALTRLPGIDIGHLSPVWFTREVLEMVVEKVGVIQDFLGIPLVLENISSIFAISEADFEEPEFVTRVCKRTGCGLLLDVTNVYINAYNCGQDPQSFLERFPLDHVVQVHLAGGVIENGWFYDTHSQEINGVNEGAWRLLERAADECDIKALIIERDQNFKEDFGVMILKDLERARSIVERRRSTQTAGETATPAHH
jgi:uncharacterized protein (UPF0276 family)